MGLIHSMQVGTRAIRLAAALSVGLSLSVSAAQPGTDSPATRRSATIPSAPPVPSPRTPVDVFRDLLAMPPAQRAAAITNRSPETRAFLEAKFTEFQALTEPEREARLQTLQLRWHILPLMKLAPDQRAPRLKLLAEADRKLVEERLQQWDLLPPELQKAVLENETLIRHAFRTSTNSGMAESSLVKVLPQQKAKLDEELARWNALPEAEQQKISEQFTRFFELNDREQSRILQRMSSLERQQMEQALRTYERLPKPQRDLCLKNFSKFAALSMEERQEFLANATRWQSLPAQDRQLWRDLMKRFQPKPPLPPGLKTKTPAPPLPPGVLPKLKTPSRTAVVTN